MNKEELIANGICRIAAVVIALTLLNACASVAPPQSAWQSGQKQMQAGQWTEARRSFERELEEHPDNQKARYNLALLLTRSGHIDDAASLYRDNLKIGWHFPSAINLAQILQTSGNTDEAITLLQKAGEKSAHEATPWYLLAEIADAQSKHDLAGQYFQKAIMADPENAYAHLRYATFQSQQKLDDSGLGEGKKALSLMPDCAVCWRQYGDILQTSGENEPARSAYQHSLAIQPSWQTRQRLIDLLRSDGHTVQADRMQEALNSWRSHHPDITE